MIKVYMERVRGLEPLTSSLARKRTTTVLHSLDVKLYGAKGRSRTDDTGFFRPVLYQLSYLGQQLAWQGVSYKSELWRSFGSYHLHAANQFSI